MLTLCPSCEPLLSIYGVRHNEGTGSTWTVPPPPNFTKLSVHIPYTLASVLQAWLLSKHFMQRAKCRLNWWGLPFWESGFSLDAFVAHFHPLLPKSFIPLISYFRALINIHSNFSSLNLLSISLPFIFSCFSFYFSPTPSPISLSLATSVFFLSRSVITNYLSFLCLLPSATLLFSYIPLWAAGFSPPCGVHLLQRWSLSSHHRQLSSVSAHAYTSIYCTLQLDNNTMLVVVNILFLWISVCSFRDSHCHSENTYCITSALFYDS